MVIPTHIAEKGSAPSFREREETRCFYTETLLHTESFTHKHFYTQTLSHRDVFHAHTQTHFHTETFTRKHFNTQTLLYTDTFTHIRFYMQMPFYRRTHTFTHKRFYTQTLLHTDTDAFPHRPFYTQTLLHTNTFTHIRFYTRTLLHANTFTYRRFYTQTLLHSDTFTHRRFSTQTLLHTDAFTHFYTETLTKRGTTGWPQLQTKVRKHSCNGNAKKSQKCTRPGSVPWSTHNPMQGIRSLRYETCIFVRLLSKQCHDMLDFKTKLNGTKLNGTMIPVVFFVHCSCISIKTSHIFFSCYTSHRSTAS